jgi:signal transduction histidine kinase
MLVRKNCWIGFPELHPDELGKPRSMSGLVYDITDRKRVEQALQHSEAFTRQILESNQDCIKVLDHSLMLAQQKLQERNVELDKFVSIAAHDLKAPLRAISNLMPILDTKRLLLTQVFANLISNAVNYHNRIDGWIEITAGDLGDRHLFSIADDGPGIPEGESQSRIFEIFQTLNSPTDSTENTGIGLALVKKIVEGEGGDFGWIMNVN